MIELSQRLDMNLIFAYKATLHFFAFLKRWDWLHTKKLKYEKQVIRFTGTTFFALYGNVLRGIWGIHSLSGDLDGIGLSMAFGIAYRLNKPVWDVQLRLGYIQTSAMLSRRIWRKLHFSVEAKYIFLPERATQTFEKRNLLTGEIEDSYSKRVRVHYLEMACGISWHL